MNKYNEFKINCNFILNNVTNTWERQYVYDKEELSLVYCSYFYGKDDSVTEFTNCRFIINDTDKLRNEYESKFITIPNFCGDSLFDFTNVKKIHCLKDNEILSSISSHSFNKDNALYNCSVSRLLGYNLIMEVENPTNDITCKFNYYDSETRVNLVSEIQESCHGVYKGGQVIFTN
jgi:hypothetical protein